MRQRLTRLETRVQNGTGEIKLGKATMLKTRFETKGELRLMIVENDFARCALFPEHGAHVTSFVPNGKKDLLWMSGKSRFERKCPLRGGIPICWPWFGAHPTDSTKPAHGFARIAEWNLDGLEETPNGGTKVAMSLSSNSDTLDIWPFEFRLKCEVLITDALTVELTTSNTGETPFEITEALHSYFNVADSAKIAVSGLDGTKYIDTIDGNAEKTQRGDIKIDSEIDRVYLNTNSDCLIKDPLLKRGIRVSKKGSDSTVVWNPWIAKSKKMPDFGDDEYTGMICVETTNAMIDSRRITPGESHMISAILAEKPV
jgi:D-hexose-6-phosphate mutarotase